MYVRGGLVLRNRIIELSEKPTRLRIRNRLLEIHPADGDGTTVPLFDIAVLIAAHPQVTYTQAVLGELASAGGVFVTCDRRRHPIAMMLPLDGFHHQAQRFRAQASAPRPLMKRCWQQIVQAKIRGQASVLQKVHGTDAGLRLLSRKVQSGDPANVEATAARKYWRCLFGPEFRRRHDEDDINHWLNYGYSVLRAIVARSICSSGLHPGLGLHHQHRASGYPLADDLMEPFRPLVDLIVHDVGQQSEFENWDAREIRQSIVGALSKRYEHDGESRSIFDWSSKLSASLASCFERSSSRFDVPEF